MAQVTGEQYYTLVIHNYKDNQVVYRFLNDFSSAFSNKNYISLCVTCERTSSMYMVQMFLGQLRKILLTAICKEKSLFMLYFSIRKLVVLLPKP